MSEGTSKYLKTQFFHQISNSLACSGRRPRVMKKWIFQMIPRIDFRVICGLPRSSKFNFTVPQAQKKHIIFKRCEALSSISSFWLALRALPAGSTKSVTSDSENEHFH